MHSKNIIVVDDDNDMNTALKRLLLAAGYCVDTFLSAEEMLMANRLEDCACLVLDIHLPGMTGFELWEQIKLIKSNVPVIFITAYDAPEFYEQAKEAGATAILIKPFSGTQLLCLIKEALT